MRGWSRLLVPSVPGLALGGRGDGERGDGGNPHAVGGGASELGSQVECGPVWERGSRGKRWETRARSRIGETLGGIA